MFSITGVVPVKRHGQVEALLRTLALMGATETVLNFTEIPVGDFTDEFVRLRLSVQLNTKLTRLGVTKIDDICAMTEAGLLSLEGIGYRSLLSIVRGLARQQPSRYLAGRDASYEGIESLKISPQSYERLKKGDIHTMWQLTHLDLPGLRQIVPNPTALLGELRTAGMGEWVSDLMKAERRR
ncbi:MAG TPA: hypothetical protein VNX65_03755 [Patescibacteria group bacterium]|nr:hypothetical protein [Patescibacteria group bacterium]